MTPDAALIALETFALAGWTATPLVLGNQNFDPLSPGGSFAAGGPFVNLRAWELSGKQIGMGRKTANAEKQWGIYGRVFYPAGQGAPPAVALGRQLGYLLKGEQIGGVGGLQIFGSYDVHDLGEGPSRYDAAVWHQVEVRLTGLLIASD